MCQRRFVSAPLDVLILEPRDTPVMAESGYSEDKPNHASTPLLQAFLLAFDTPKGTRCKVQTQWTRDARSLHEGLARAKSWKEE